MQKIIFTCGLLLCFLPGCSSVIKKEDILLQAQHIKATAPPELLKPVVPRFSPLPAQEKFVYKAKYLGITVGEFIMINNGKTMFNGRETYCFELVVKTLPFFSKVFKTKDRYVSYMDAHKHVILRHEEYIKDGTYLESAVDFDYETRTASYKNFVNQREKKVTIPDKTLDAFSGGFYLRMVPWGLGDTVELIIYADEKVYNYIGLLHSKTTVQLPGRQSQDAYLLKPYVFIKGEPIKKTTALVFFSATTSRIPLRAVLKTPLGNVQVVLVEGFDKTVPQGD